MSVSLSVCPSVYHASVLHKNGLAHHQVIKTELQPRDYTEGEIIFFTSSSDKDTKRRAVPLRKVSLLFDLGAYLCYVLMFRDMWI